MGQSANVVAAATKTRDQDRAKSNEAASKASDKPKWNTDDDYMKAQDKETIKRQQEKMADTADWETTKQNNKAQPPSFKKGGMVVKTGMAKVHKGERILTKRQQMKSGTKKTARKKG